MRIVAALIGGFLILEVLAYLLVSQLGFSGSLTAFPVILLALALGSLPIIQVSRRRNNKRGNRHAKRTRSS